MKAKDLSARSVAGIVVELEICHARIARLRGAIDATRDQAAHTRIFRRLAEVHKEKHALVESLAFFCVEQQIAEAFNPGEVFFSEASDLIRGGAE